MPEIKIEPSRYGFDTEYTYNDFGADAHFNVNLWKRSKNNKTWKLVQTWSFGCGVFGFENSIAHARGEKRIKKLRKTYEAAAI